MTTRRDFLQKLSIGIGAVTLLPTSSKAPYFQFLPKRKETSRCINGFGRLYQYSS